MSNLNSRKMAVNCMAYLESAIKLPETVPATLKTVELKWAGYTQPNVIIMSQSYRDLDAFFVLHNAPNILRFSCFSDSSCYMMPILGYGRYQLNYEVMSENFAPVRIATEGTIGNSVDDVSLVQT